jgi:hypothetical protein
VAAEILSFWLAIDKPILSFRNPSSVRSKRHLGGRACHRVWQDELQGPPRLDSRPSLTALASSLFFVLALTFEQKHRDLALTFKQKAS